MQGPHTALEGTLESVHVCCTAIPRLRSAIFVTPAHVVLTFILRSVWSTMTMVGDFAAVATSE